MVISAKNHGQLIYFGEVVLEYPKSPSFLQTWDMGYIEYIYNVCVQIRIDRLIDKWSGSIEIGITTHNPNLLEFPATMTNMKSGLLSLLYLYFVILMCSQWLFSLQLVITGCEGLASCYSII